MEIDILIPSLNLGIEIDGIFWHSFNKMEEPYQKTYHKFKQSLCKQRNIKLIRIYESEWNEKQEIVKSRILNLLNKSNKIYARKCKIININYQQCKNFMNMNHIQGHVNYDCAYGLEFENELVAIMTFSKPRYNKNYEWELLRYCNKLNTTVIGGVSKLFNYFTQTKNPKNVISYADLRWGDGNVYSYINFVRMEDTLPNYYWIKSDKVYSRIQFQKHKLKDKLEDYDPTLSEAENMFMNGYRRLWDCGNSKWEWINPQIED